MIVIVRKDKRLRKGLHLAAFALTGGASAPVTAIRAGQIGAYNRRTRKLQAGPATQRRGPEPTFTAEELAYMHAHCPANPRE